LTSEERAALSDLTLRPLPADPTNAVAQDANAAALGQMLFFDTRFSGPLAIGDDGSNGGLGAVGEVGRVACASCHDPANGGTDHRSHGGTSLAAGWTGRAAPSVLNAAFSPWMFWDGRKDSQWSQALGPPEGGVEMNSTRLQVAHFIATTYRAQYEQVFGSLPDLSDQNRFPPTGKPGQPSFDRMAPEDKITINRIYSNFGKAIAAYERLLIDADSPFDRYMRGDVSAMNESAVRGAKLFVGRASCNECHSGPTLSDGKFHNHAVPQVGAAVPAIDRARADGIPQVMTDPFNGAGIFSDAPNGERLDALAVQDRDVGAFKTPTLRNLTKTAPYMHTGRFATIWDAAVWYRDAAGSDGFVGPRDPAVQPLRLSDADLVDLVEFLKALEGAPLPSSLVTAPTLP